MSEIQINQRYPDSKTVYIPPIELNYDGDKLESIGIGGERFIRGLTFDRLKAENSELREQTRWIEQTDSRWSAAIRDLEAAQAENAALRELVKALNWCIDNGSNELGCDGCPLPQSSKRECECEIRMRELGVEL